MTTDQDQSAMDFLTRINAVLHRTAPDQVPFAPYDNLVPRGEFVRELQNRGMGLCLRRSTIWSAKPNVTVETRHEDGTLLTIYHTPEGSVATRHKVHAGRVSDSETFELEGMIKTPADYDPVLFMIEDTVYGLDPDVYHNTVRDVGRDGIFRDHALDPEAEMTPYGATRKYFGEAYGLKQWVFAQADQPDHFAKLVEALERREERRLQLVVESPAEFVGFSCVEGLWGPEKMRRYELPFYERWIPYLQRHGKVCAVHADAINLHRLKEVVALTGVDVVEAFTPPPVGNLSLADARQAWGPETVIWVNFPETVFWFGPEEVKRYTVELLKSDAPGRALVLGFTEMGLWGAADDATAAVFRACTLAIMEALEEHGVYPIHP